MVQQVERWLAEDGTQFNTRDEAVVHEEYSTARSKVFDFLSCDSDRDGRIDLDELLDNIKSSKNVQELFTNYIAMSFRYSQTFYGK